MSEDYISFIINKYSITESQEIRALYLYYYWVVNRKKIFPDMIHGKFNKTKDPRTSSIFKYCYKLQRETKDTLEEKNYENYIRAQLVVLKYLSKKYNKDLVIDANIIVGEKAWKRWKSFAARLRKSKNNSINEIVLFPNINKLEVDFINTKKFLLANIKELNKENIENNIENIIIWFRVRKINPYFIVFNEFINQKFNYDEIRKIFKIDPILYKERTNDRIKELYDKIFKEKT